ncbi:MAG: alanine--tRNA ligase, partial [Frankia sp.]|nr:alanine--tRNA ligase [Frankia sp.]
MRSADIRTKFVEHFQRLDHAVVPSASLVADDPTLLLVNAGMVPFKPYFLGQLPPPWPRAVSVQKVVRTVDIDVVGTTSRHASFFEMCGNFSFGDYFKEKAIPYAWELLTEGYGFPPDLLWATVYTDDDEAARIWHRDVGLPEERIQRRGKADNYWHMGVPGPGGPCSEIYYDRGEKYGREGGPIADEERYLEVWNLVFMQSELGAVRSKEDFDIVGDLPAQNIDTGMGLDRMAVVLQGVESIFDSDLVFPIVQRAEELTGARYGTGAQIDVRLRVVGDHARTATMLIADGVIPGNEGRGYVLRRMLRRAVRSARLLGADEPVMEELVAAVRGTMSAGYPELDADFARVAAVARTEEEAFLDTLRTGTTLFDTAVTQAKASGATVLPGAEAFRLHDTYGFPIDLTLEMAREQGLDVDEESFRALMREQRERSQAERRGKQIGNVDVGAYRDAF